MLCEGVRRHGLAGTARHADDEAELQLDVQPPRRRVHRLRRVGRLQLAARPHDVGAADDDRAGAAVVADGQPAPVREQRLRVRPEHPPQVRRVLERRVEVDVVGDREGQVERRVGQADARAVGGLRRRHRLAPGLRALRQQAVE